MNLDNNWYGQTFILNLITKNKNKLIYGGYQHGWISSINATKTKPSLGERKFLKNLPFFCWNEKCFNNLKKVNKKKLNFFIIGSPFLYVDKILSSKKVKEKNEILFFPANQKIQDSLRSNHNNIINFLNKKKLKVNVCLFYKDFQNKKIHDLYKKNKIKLYCCGTRKNLYFYFKLYNLFKQHKYIYFNSICSGLFYSLFLKKKTLLFLNRKYSNYLYDFEKKDILYYKKYYKFLFKKKINIRKGFELAKSELGFKHLRSKEKLNEILGFKSNIKQIVCKIYYFLSYIYFKLTNKLKFLDM